MLEKADVCGSTGGLATLNNWPKPSILCGNSILLADCPTAVVRNLDPPATMRDVRGDLGFRLLFRKGSSVEDTAIEMIIPRRTSQCNAAIPNCASTIAGAACKAAPAIVDEQFGMAALRAKKATCPAPWSACFLLLDNSGVYEGEVKTLPPIPHC